MVSLCKYAAGIHRPCILRSYTQNSQTLYLNTYSPPQLHVKLKVQISICIHGPRKEKFKCKCNTSKSLPRDKITILSIAIKLLLSFHCWIFKVSLRLLFSPCKFLPNHLQIFNCLIFLIIIFLLVGCYLNMT